jgi:hypothetical protein
MTKAFIDSRLLSREGYPSDEQKDVRRVRPEILDGRVKHALFLRADGGTPGPQAGHLHARIDITGRVRGMGAHRDGAPPPGPMDQSKKCPWNRSLNTPPGLVKKYSYANGVGILRSRGSEPSRTPIIWEQAERVKILCVKVRWIPL